MHVVDQPHFTAVLQTRRHFYPAGSFLIVPSSHRTEQRRAIAVPEPFLIPKDSITQEVCDLLIASGHAIALPRELDQIAAAMDFILFRSRTWHRMFLLMISDNCQHNPTHPLEWYDFLEVVASDTVWDHYRDSDDRSRSDHISTIVQKWTQFYKQFGQYCESYAPFDSAVESTVVIVQQIINDTP
jgi:hypothetical protein